MKPKHGILGLVVALLAAAAVVVASRAKGTVTPVAASAQPEVEVKAVEQRDLPIEREWVGTLDGKINASIKAQVTGYLLSQDYAEGSFVRKGQLLFEIDPKPFQTAVEQATGQLAQAKAQVAQARAGLVQA
jgi:membrane fusion protein (multidrug efflux system)